VVNFDVRIKLIDIDKDLRPGMSCNASIETETINNVISVPLQSVTARGGFSPANPEEGEEGEEGNQNVKQEKKGNDNKPKEIVFIVKNGKAKSINVKTGLSDDNFIEIKEGLKSGEEVITGSYRAISRELNDGSIVHVEEKGKSPGENKN
jgi:HlyD family secretion protein